MLPVAVGGAPASPPAPASPRSNGLGAPPLPPQAATSPISRDDPHTRTSARRNALSRRHRSGVSVGLVPLRLNLVLARAGPWDEGMYHGNAPPPRSRQDPKARLAAGPR